MMRHVIGRGVAALFLSAVWVGVGLANVHFVGTVTYSNGQARDGVQASVECGAGVTNGCTNAAGYFDISPHACGNNHTHYYVTVCGETRSYAVGGGWYDTGNWVHDGSCGGCGGGSGCFLAGTEISLADGSTVPIERIASGDRILGYDLSVQRTAAAMVSHVFECRDEPGYLVINETIRVTRSHPFLSDGEWVLAGELRPGQSLTDAKGHAVPVNSVRAVNETTKVYNFSVDGLETYVAAGVVVHNKRPPSQQQPNEP